MKKLYFFLNMPAKGTKKKSPRGKQPQAQLGLPKDLYEALEIEARKRGLINPRNGTGNRTQLIEVMLKEFSMSIQTRRNAILKTFNEYELLPNEDDLSALSKIQFAAEGGSPLFDKYSNHQREAAEITQKELGSNISEILAAYATIHPPLFKGLKANQEHYDNWLREHCLTPTELAQVWVENESVLTYWLKVNDSQGSSNDARNLAKASSVCQFMIKARSSYQVKED